MESPSEPQSRVVSPWRRLLITASILSCWIQPKSAQFSVVSNPPYGKVKHNVILDIQDYSGRAISYTWYKKTITDPNEIAVYMVESGVQEPANIPEKVFPNGSLLIPHLALSDTDAYLVVIVNSKCSIVARGHLTVIEQYMGENNGSSFAGGAITGIVIGVLTAVTLIGTLIYIQYFRKTRRASKDQLSEKNHSARQHGEAITMYENIVHFRGSALPAQGLGSSPTFPEDPPESSYETLDITKVDVYDKIDPLRKPEA